MTPANGIENQSERSSEKTRSLWDARAKVEGLHAVFTSRWSEEQCKSVDEQQASAILELAGDLSGHRVLDLGCGIGRLSARLAETGAAEIIGADISPDMIARARDAVKAARFVVMTPGVLPFERAYFDTIVASFVFQHIPDKMTFQRTVEECCRVLKGSGRLIMMEGLASKPATPRSNSQTTIRTLEDYKAAFQEFLREQTRADYTWIDDRYKAIVWSGADK